MSILELNGVTVFASAVESVEDGWTHEYDRLWNRAVTETMLLSWGGLSEESYEEEQKKIVLPNVKDHPAVIVKLTSGREFRIVGMTRREVEQDILLARRRDR